MTFFFLSKQQTWAQRSNSLEYSASKIPNDPNTGIQNVYHTVLVFESFHTISYQIEQYLQEGLPTQSTSVVGLLALFIDDKYPVTHYLIMAWWWHMLSQNMVNTASGNSLLLVWHQTLTSLTWTNAAILLIEPTGTNFNEMWIFIYSRNYF